MMEAIQRLQTLQAISRLQEMARQRNGASGEEASEPGTQQALAMVVIPIQSQESRQAVSHSSPFAPHAASPVSPYAAQAAYSPRPAYYPAPHMSPYAPSPYGYHVYHPMVHPAASYAAPVHMPYPSHYPYRPSFGHYPIYPRAPMHPAYTHVRPRVMEMPLDMAMHAPAAMHAPVPMGAVRDHREHQAINLRDHDQSPSDQDHIVLLYDAEVADHDGEGDDLQQSASEHTKMAHGPKGHHFLSQQLPANPSFNKMKLWREMVGAKHAAQPGVRYMPVAIETEESHQQPNQYNAHPRPQVHQQAPQFTHHPQMVDQEHHQPQRGHLESRDTQEHPAFLVMADQDEPTQRRR
ncbi:hypothetical protein HDE_10712 [Halotydeus destructor]|nr:hypothetical protein HDE_10712 [Halotydeus destructor]